VGVVGGKCEYYGKVNVLNTKDDKVDYISDEAMLRNLGNAAYGIYGLLNSDGLISNLSNNPNMAAYNVFTNTYVASWLPLLILIVLLLITVIVYFTISGRTIKYAQDHNITGVMITIDQDEDEK